MNTRQKAALISTLQYNFSNFGYRTKLSRLAFLANELSTSSGVGLLAVALQQEKRL